MVSLKLKWRFTYFTIGAYFLFTEIEYAVILPTVYLYLTETFNAPTYFMGLVLSAYCLADMIAGPVVGRWSDRSANTKLIVLISNIPQVCGCIMYCLGTSAWMLVAGRFISGLGSSVGSALIADIARVTSNEERTSVLSIFMAVRQIGLLVGPGFNLFLRLVDFQLGPFTIDAYRIPGLFMAGIWILHEIVTIFFFWNLPSLYLEQQLEDSAQYGHQRSQSEGFLPSIGIVSSDLRSNGAGSGADPTQTQRLSLNRDALLTENSDSAIDSDPRTEGETLYNSYVSGSSSVVVSRPHNDAIDDLSLSNEVIEKAEHLMTRRRLSERRSVDNNATSTPIPGHVSTIVEPDTTPLNNRLASRRSSSPNRNNSGEDPVSDVREIPRLRVCGSDGASLGAQSSVGEIGAAHDIITLGDQGHSLRYYLNEFIREETVAILATVFVSYFNQLALETIITPLTNRLLNWKEVENSILYSVCAVEMIAVFLIIRGLARCVSDRSMILFGFSIETVVVAFFIWFIPRAVPGDLKINIPVVISSIFIELLGVPFILLASNSIFTKLTRTELQGFAQGIRRIAVGCGNILGPLWASMVFVRPYLTFSVMVAVNLIVMLILILSFGRLRPRDELLQQDRSGRGEGEREPLLQQQQQRQQQQLQV